jgi:hypothetical protein
MAATAWHAAFQLHGGQQPSNARLVLLAAHLRQYVVVQSVVASLENDAHARTCPLLLLQQALAALDRSRDELACQLDASREEAAQLAEEAAAARSAADETAR